MFGHMSNFGWNGYYMPMFGRGFGGFFPEIIFLILFVILVYILLRRGKPVNNKQSEALELAKIRFVKGEISEEEYQKIVAVIKK